MNSISVARNDLLKRLIAISALLIAVSIWLVPPSQWVTRLFFEIGIERIVFFLIIYWVLLQLKGIEGEILRLSFTVGIFSISLFYKWQSLATFFTLGGFLPLSDALGYYNDAQNILHGLDISGLGVYRPVYTSFLSTILFIVRNDLRYAAFAFVLINSIAVYFCAREVHAAFQSDLGSAVFMILSFVYYKRFSGTLMTENLGFCLGMMALYFLIRSAKNGQVRHLFFGLILLTVALNARAGAFFTLPLIALWAGNFAATKKQSVRQVGMAFLIVSIAMIACIGIPKLYSASNGTHSNYADNLYGLAVGNKGYEQSFRDHPGATKEEVFKFAIEQIKTHPTTFLYGILGAYRDYFDPAFGANSFLLLKHDRGDMSNMILWASTIAGLIAGIIRRDEKIFFVSLVFFAGIFLSIGLVPPADSVRMRVYAASIPMSIYIVVAGIAFIQSFFRNNQQIQAGNLNEFDSALPALFSGILLFSALAAPLLIKSFGTLPQVTEGALDCAGGFEKRTLIIGQSSSLQFLPGIGSSFAPNIYKTEFDRETSKPDQQISEEEKSYLIQLPPDKAIVLASSYKTDSTPVTALSSRIFVMDRVAAPGGYTACIKTGGMNVINEATSMDAARLMSRYEIAAGTKTLFLQFQKTVLFATLFFAILYFSNFYNLPSPVKYWSVVCWLAILPGIAVISHVSGWVPLFWDEKALDSSQFRNPSGFLYRLNIANHDFSDTLYWDFPSKLYENDFQLFPAHESQSIITEYGRGGYILKGNFLYFSSSDNSDPRNNGRSYTLEKPGNIRLRYQVPAYLLAIAGLVGLKRLVKPIPFAE